MRRSVKRPALLAKSNLFRQPYICIGITLSSPVLLNQIRVSIGKIDITFLIVFKMLGLSASADAIYSTRSTIQWKHTRLYSVIAQHLFSVAD